MHTQLSDGTKTIELPLSTTTKCEVRSVLRFLCAKREGEVDNNRLISLVYGADVMTIKMVRQWIREFDEGRTDIHHAPRLGRPSYAAHEDSLSAV